MEGFEDPLNRGTYPWGREDRDLLAWFTRLGALRNAYPALQSGTISLALHRRSFVDFCPAER